MRVVVQRIDFQRMICEAAPIGAAFFFPAGAVLDPSRDALGTALLVVAGAAALYAAAGEAGTRHDAGAVGRGRLAARRQVHLDHSRRQRRLPGVRAFAQRTS